MPAHETVPQDTTARYVVRYRQELVDGGVAEHVADEMARDAARLLIAGDGSLVVKR